jgi:hypothetical protein
MSLFNIRGGDRVTIVDQQGKQRTGRANPLLCFADHVVLNMGGRYGTPAYADAKNIVRVARASARKGRQ